jgi:hypothetical protein
LAISSFLGLLTRPWPFNTIKNRPISGNEKQVLSIPETLLSPQFPSTFSDGGEKKNSDTFTFKNLQAIQHIEEKAHEAMLVLKLNTEVLEQLRLNYDEVTKHAGFPRVVRDHSEASLHQFGKGVVGVEKDLRMLQSRTETLLHLLANRKNLVSTTLIILRLVTSLERIKATPFVLL